MLLQKSSSVRNAFGAKPQVVARRMFLGVPIAGSIPLFMVGVMIYLFFATAIGIFLGTVARSMPQLGLLFMLVYVPMNQLSGSNTPLDSMPPSLATAMQALPSTHFVSFAQAILYRGAGNGVVCCLRMTALRPVIVVRSSVQNPTIPCDQRLFQGLSTASPMRAPSGRNRFHCRRTKTVGLRPTVLVRCLMAGMAGRRSGRNGCFGASAAGVLQ